MANFDKVILNTLKSEGKYSNHPSDNGGETYAGIARKYNPDWTGWKLIDDFKLYDSFPNNIDYNAILPLIKDYYKKTYWDCFGLDNISDDNVAYKIFDIAVNCGIKTSTLLLQRALNALNKDNRFGADLIIDGSFGKNTLFSLNKCNSLSKNGMLYKCLSGLQTVYYIQIVENNNSQKVFIDGWINRV